MEATTASTMEHVRMVCVSVRNPMEVHTALLVSDVCVCFVCVCVCVWVCGCVFKIFCLIQWCISASSQIPPLVMITPPTPPLEREHVNRLVSVSTRQVG